MTSFLSHPLFLAAVGDHSEDRLTIFFTQIALLIVIGRLLGELMQRIGQPAVMGQLLAGIVLGPSIFGAIWPAGQQLIFPVDSSGRQMLSAVSELGILLLLLLTGMETDLALVKRVRRSATFTSAGGILLPFICGYLLGEALPDSVLPDPSRRLMTSLFLATALSISSVKIVAAVLREVDFLRRDLGQVILASSILDDTIGWIILALIGGLAAHGRVMVGSLLFSIVGTAIFIVFCFTIGSSWVARIIRWTNDTFVMEMPVISAILVITLALALLTSSIGVHTVLGAFMAGIMIGQSPILTRHIEEQLRGFIVALFMPVFFGVAGLSIDLKVLFDPHLFGLALLVIAIASFGKLGGCYLGSRSSGLTHPESLAVGLGMNARGSTEIILATIGLSLGVLNHLLFTIIVLMAVVTTLCMPPLLRWALSNVSMREEERLRLETEAAEEKDLLPKIERLLVGLGTGEGNRFAARLAGSLIGARRLTATVLDWVDPEEPESKTGSRPPSDVLLEATESALQSIRTRQKASTPTKAEEGHPLDAAANPKKAEEISANQLVSILKPKKPGEPAAENPFAESILAEVKNGYGMIFLGTGLTSNPTEFQNLIATIARQFTGPTAILFASKTPQADASAPLTRILVPTIGADYSRFGAEVAVAIAKSCDASITALHVSVSSDNELLRYSAKLRRTGRTLVADIEALGKREGVRVEPKALMGRVKESAILRQAELGGHQLIVLGTKSQSAEQSDFGGSVLAIIEKAPCPVLVLKS